MPIKNIKAILKIETDSNELAEIIHAAIDPDNLTEPPMTFYSVFVSKNIEYRMDNIRSIETLFATLMDLLAVFQVTEKALNTFSSEIG